MASNSAAWVSALAATAALVCLAGAEAVGEHADRASKERRFVPLHDGAEIVIDKQRWSARAVGQYQRCLESGQRRRVGGAHTQLGPFGRLPPHIEPGEA